MKTTRTDCHSPSNFDPSKYSYVGTIYQGSHAKNVPSMNSALEAVKALGWKDGNFATKGTCDHCGASFLYGAAFQHDNGTIVPGDIIVVGHMCADEAFGHDSRRSYDLARAKSAVKAARERERNAEYAKAFYAANPGLDEALNTDHHISTDLRRKLELYGSLSEKQVALAFKLQKQAAELEARKAEDAVRSANAPDWSAGRHTVEGTVLVEKPKDTPWGTSIKILLLLDDGRKCWGTAPDSLLWANRSGGEGSVPTELRGARVSFTANFTPSDDDKKFAFYKRPTKPSLLSLDMERNPYAEEIK